MRKILLYLFVALFLVGIDVKAEQPAFPGAEGGGMYATGGRGGNVYFVNSLADTETGNSTTREGTLRWCLKQTGPRTIIFKVSGIIELTKTLSIPAYTTIAGQTAPGDGICLKNYSLRLAENASHIIVRYIRSRMGDEKATADDAMSGRYCNNVIIDHCSFSWSTDECASFYDNSNFTLQWSILSESLRESVHDKGTHGYGGIWGGKTASFHHNLLAHHDSRNPRMCGSRYSNRPDLELVDFRNNVIYNWGGNSGYAGEGGSYNFVNNYYKASDYSSNKDRIFQPYPDNGSNAQPAGVWGVFYVDGNYVTASTDVTSDNWQGIDPNGTLPVGGIDAIKSTTEFAVPYVTTQTAQDAYELVLDGVGASFKRDSTDIRVINEVRHGLAPVRASNGTTRGGLIDTQTDVGGWDAYIFNSADVPTDTDRDGMPDDWETANGLNPNSATDRNTVAASGYTMLEEYINNIGITTAVKTVIKTIDEAVVYPNPASGLSKVTFFLASSEDVKVDFIDLTGQERYLIAQGNYGKGKNEISFDATRIVPGIYICRVASENSSAFVKVMVK